MLNKTTNKELSIKESTTNIGGSFKTDLTPDGKLSEKDLIQLAKSFSSKKN